MTSKGLTKGGAPIRRTRAKCTIPAQPFLEHRLFEAGNIERGCDHEGPAQY